MDFEAIIYENYPRQEQLYWTGYFNSSIEQNMLSSEVERKGQQNCDSNPTLYYAIKIFHKQFMIMMDLTWTVEEMQFYTALFSKNDHTILDNV